MFLFPMPTTWVAPHCTSDGTFLWAFTYGEFREADDKTYVLNVDEVRASAVVALLGVIVVVNVEMSAIGTVEQVCFHTSSFTGTRAKQPQHSHSGKSPLLICQ